METAFEILKYTLPSLIMFVALYFVMNRFLDTEHRKQLSVLKKEGFIRGYSVKDNKDKKNILIIELKYFEGKPAIKEIKRASKPGLRLYSSSNDMPLNYGGLGISIVSTSNGLMSDHDARNANIGGEILCSVF
jgi:small subunit ribosomal protein S8